MSHSHGRFLTPPHEVLHCPDGRERAGPGGGGNTGPARSRASGQGLTPCVLHFGFGYLKIKKLKKC